MPPGTPLHDEPPSSIAGPPDDVVRLRAWRDDDRAPFAAVNDDPEVMRYFPARRTREESDAMVDRLVAAHRERGFGLWALEVDSRFAGFVGLSPTTFEAPFTPAIEIGWRLARWAWGRGAASSAARRVLAAAPSFGIDEVVSFTAVDNARSRAVMSRIGMTHEWGSDFEHPALPAGHPLRRHVLYRWPADGAKTPDQE